MNGMNNTKKTYRSALFAAILLAVTSTPAHAESPDDILIVAHPGVDQSEIVPGEVRAIFLKKKTSWPSGDKIVPINAKPGTDLRKRFQEFIIEMDPSLEGAYWENQKIRYGMSPPAEFSIPLRAVFALKGSIGYVFRKDFKEGVAKVLLVIPGYE